MHPLLDNHGAVVVLLAVAGCLAIVFALILAIQGSPTMPSDGPVTIDSITARLLDATRAGT